MQFGWQERSNDQSRGKQWVSQTYGILGCGVDVFDSGKSSKSISPYVYPQGITRSHTYVDSEVKLEPVDQKGLKQFLIPSRNNKVGLAQN